MKNKTLVILVLAILGAGIIISGFLYYNQTKPSSLVQNTAENVPAQNQVEKVVIQPSPTIIQPTLPPISDTVKSIDDSMITLTGKSGDLLLPKMADKVKVFKRSATGLVEATFTDLKVGQSVTFTVIPNQYGQLIIESK